MLQNLPNTVSLCSLLTKELATCTKSNDSVMAYVHVIPSDEQSLNHHLFPKTPFEIPQLMNNQKKSVWLVSCSLCQSIFAEQCGNLCVQNNFYMDLCQGHLIDNEINCVGSRYNGFICFAFLATLAS